MNKLKTLLRLIGIVQLILGIGFLVAPSAFLVLMGLSASVPDNNYMFGMLAARFLAYGVGMFAIARAPEENRFWINNMILIQVIDLAAGLFYTFTGVVNWMNVVFPMFNATVFIVLLWLWRPREGDAGRVGVKA